MKSWPDSHPHARKSLRIPLHKIRCKAIYPNPFWTFLETESAGGSDPYIQNLIQHSIVTGGQISFCLCLDGGLIVEIHSFSAQKRHASRLKTSGGVHSCAVLFISARISKPCQKNLTSKVPISNDRQKVQGQIGLIQPNNQENIWIDMFYVYHS